MSSGGSTARYSVDRLASLLTSRGVSPQTQTSSPSDLRRGIAVFNPAGGTLASLWLRILPAAPAALSDSGMSAPVLCPTWPTSALRLQARFFRADATAPT